MFDLPTAAMDGLAPPENTGFAWTTVPRHGRRPLGFHGRVLIRAACRQPELPVWSEMTLHEAQDGTFVAAVRHVLRALADTEGAASRCYVEASTDPSTLFDLLLAHDPLADLPVETLLGDGGDGDARNAPRHAAQLREAWRALLAAALGRSGTPAADTTRDV